MVGDEILLNEDSVRVASVYATFVQLKLSNQQSSASAIVNIVL